MQRILRSKTRKEVFDDTVDKFESIGRELKDCLEYSDLERAEKSVDLLRSYETCFYCVNFRQTLDAVSGRGLCEGCPLHIHGEQLEGRKLFYNGCYKIGVYRTMVKSAVWYKTSPSAMTLQAVYDDLTKALDYLKAIREKVC